MGKYKFSEQIKAMAEINGHHIFPEIKAHYHDKPRKRRAIETKPRVMAEKEIEEKIIWYVRLHPWMRVGKIDPVGSSYNAKYLFHGIADLLVLNLRDCVFGFVEVKAKKCTLKGKQLEFKQYCDDLGIVHIVADCNNDLDVLIRKEMLV